MAMDVADDEIERAEVRGEILGGNDE